MVKQINEIIMAINELLKMAIISPATDQNLVCWKFFGFFHGSHPLIFLAAIPNFIHITKYNKLNIKYAAKGYIYQFQWVWELLLNTKGLQAGFLSTLRVSPVF